MPLRKVQFGPALAVAGAVAMLGACRPAQPPPESRPRPDTVEIGYGSQPRTHVTGAISSMPVDSASGKVTSLVDMIEGRFPGVEVVRRSGRVSLRVRGARTLTAGDNEPLYVLDGIPYATGSSILTDIDPRDVKAIDVLKDAAATSVYGSRGANGVILITTKRGR